MFTTLKKSRKIIKKIGTGFISKRWSKTAKVHVNIICYKMAKLIPFSDWA
jgi:hypothetical protein